MLMGLEHLIQPDSGMLGSPGELDAFGLGERSRPALG